MNLQSQIEYFRGEYSASLNSEDLHDPDLPLVSNRAKGGTLVMWRKHLDPFLSIYSTESTAFLPVIIDIPNVATSIHVALYLPTAGKEVEYLSELAKLTVALQDLLEKYPNSVIFIRGDANSSKTNVRRCNLFHSFCRDFNLSRVPLNHKTYHHFQGLGASDSELDVLLYSNHEGVHERLSSIQCRQENPLVDSHHDLLFSSCTIPCIQVKGPETSQNVSDPKLENQRHKILWSAEGIKTP
jgi:hypothetical protein